LKKINENKNEINYYEDSEAWKPEKIRKVDIERIEKVMSFLPETYSSLLDLGCGNGIFCNKLIETSKQKQRIVGVDRSNEALKHVKSEKKNCDITKLSFPDKEFDIVCSLEVIEHLSDEDFFKTLNEISRVCKRQIIITVPNNENLQDGMLECPKCKIIFHRNYHQRSFNEEFLNNLFLNQGFHCVHIEKIGQKLEKKFLKESHQLLDKITNKSKKTITPFGRALCPKCGYSERNFSNKVKYNSKFKKIINSFWPKEEKFRWLLAVYEN
jgi:ubiquinone/menaquinone biosynthesis C-methylase UbiE